LLAPQAQQERHVYSGSVKCSIWSLRASHFVARILGGDQVRYALRQRWWVFTYHQDHANDFEEWSSIRTAINRKASTTHDDAIVTTLRDFEKENITIARLLRLPQRNYDEQSTDLLQLCKNAIIHSIQLLHDDGTLIRRYGVSLLTQHDLTIQDLHPYEDEVYSDEGTAALREQQRAIARMKMEREAHAASKGER